MKLAVLQTVEILYVAGTTRALPAGAEEKLDTGEPTVSVTCLFELWRTSWSMLQKPDHGTGSTGQETYRRIMFGLRPGNSSCLNLQSSPR